METRYALFVTDGGKIVCEHSVSGITGLLIVKKCHHLAGHVEGSAYMPEVNRLDFAFEERK